MNIAPNGLVRGQVLVQMAQKLNWAFNQARNAILEICLNMLCEASPRIAL